MTQPNEDRFFIAYRRSNSTVSHRSPFHFSLSDGEARVSSLKKFATEGINWLVKTKNPDPRRRIEVVEDLHTEQIIPYLRSLNMKGEKENEVKTQGDIPPERKNLTGFEALHNLFRV